MKKKLDIHFPVHINSMLMLFRHEHNVKIYIFDIVVWPEKVLLGPHGGRQIFLLNTLK